jgi:hypothetical protein
MFMNASYHPSGRRGLLTKGLLWVFFFGFLASAHAQYTATVDLNTKYQTFEGWGTALAWWANVAGGYPDSCSGASNCSTRSSYISSIFDPTSGLGLNVVRYNIGGGENPQYLPPNNTYLQYRARVPGFLSSATAQYDWTQDANQRWVLQQAIQQGVTIQEAFSNSPPWWMTNSGSVTGATDAGNNLNPAYASNFADYLSSVAQHYHDTWGITFRTVEPFNEPVAGWWKFGGNQEGSGFDRTTQNSFVKTLGASLATKNMSYASVSASDENSIDDALLSFNAMDTTAQGYMGQVNTHTYAGSERTQLAAAVSNASKRLSVSEYGDNDGTGMTMAYQILDDLQNLQPENWTYWQAVDNGSGWGFLYNVLDGSSNSGYAFSQKYYVMGNFSKFLRPGYQFVSISDSNSVAAYDGQGTVAIVTASNNSSDQQVTYNIDNLTSGMGTGPWTVTPYRTSAKENLAALPSFSISTSTFTAMINASSVTTFVVTNPATVPIVDGGQYLLFNEWGIGGAGESTTGQVLEEPGWTQEAGAELDLWGTGNNRNQVWIAHNAGGNNWEFTNLNTTSQWCGSCSSELALDIAGTTAGSSAVQNPRTDDPSQIWSVTPAGDGGFYITNTQTGLNLQFVNWWGNPMPAVQINPVSSMSDNNERWTFVPFTASPGSSDPPPPAATQLTMSTYTSPVYNTNDENLTATLTTPMTTAATGTVTFYDGSTALGTVNIASNAASFDAGKLSVGTHYISAIYSGDASNFTSSTGMIPILSKLGYATTTTLTSSANPAAQGQTINFTLGVTSDHLPLSGNFTLTSNGTALATVPVTDNAASYSTSSLAAGAYTIIATYSGDSVHLSSSATVLQEVRPAGTSASSITLTSSPSAPIVGNSITLNATVTGTGATGTVYFIDGSDVIGSAQLSSSGSASLSTSSLAVGTHSLTAYYNGDANFAPATSSVDSLQVYSVPVGDYALSTSLNEVRLSGGGASISIVTSGGFDQPITFSCSGLPAGYTCSFSPASITPDSTGIKTTKMTIVGQSSAALDQKKFVHGFITTLAGLGFLGLPLCWRFRRKMGMSLLLLLAVFGSFGWAIQGCGSSTPTATYSVVVTGTSLPLTHSVTIQALK